MSRREGEVVARGDGRWMIRWSLGRDESTGRYRAKSKTIHGTRRDAERELRRIQRSRDTGEYVDPSKETLNVFLDRWLTASGSRVSPRTLEGYRWLLRRYVRPTLGSLRLVQIRPLYVQALVNGLEKSFSPRTVRLACTILGAALKQAVKWGVLHRNPAIRRALTKVDGRPGFKEPKTAGSRRGIPLPSSLVAVLRDHRKRQAEHALKLGASYDRASDLVFANEAGKPLDSRNVVNRHFKPAVKAAGLPSPLRLYDLRHTHATMLMAEGINPKVVAERLGHATTRQTLDTYSHVQPGMQEEATRRIEEALFR